LPESVWRRADLVFVRESDRGGRWEARRGARAEALGENPEWHVGFAGSRFIVRPTPFKHVGVFPEQASNWSLIARAARGFGAARPRLLNLFGYTGAASVIAARAGYEVTHVDASKASLAWARENLRASDIPDDAVRIVLDDALVFARREARRKAKYHAVLLDPPHYGRGPKGERWQFEEDIAPLIECVASLLAERALAILSTYAIGCSPLTLHNLMLGLGAAEVAAGELALPESGAEDPPRPAHAANASNAANASSASNVANVANASNVARPRWLPAGFCARWSRGITLAADHESGA
jgi:23S rRNA (cytosine1962-C5)-methyltransferase